MLDLNVLWHFIYFKELNALLFLSSRLVERNALTSRPWHCHPRLCGFPFVFVLSPPTQCGFWIREKSWERWPIFLQILQLQILARKFLWYKFGPLCSGLHWFTSYAMLWKISFLGQWQENWQVADKWLRLGIWYRTCWKTSFGLIAFLSQMCETVTLWHILCFHVWTCNLNPKKMWVLSLMLQIHLNKVSITSWGQRQAWSLHRCKFARLHLHDEGSGLSQGLKETVDFVGM